VINYKEREGGLNRPLLSLSKSLSLSKYYYDYTIAHFMLFVK
jgi:hypothetical protein